MPHRFGPKEIHGLLVPPGKAYNLLTSLPLGFEPAQEKWFQVKPSLLADIDGYIRSTVWMS